MREIVRSTDKNGEDNPDLVFRDQSIELRNGLEQLMDHIQSHRHEESSDSFEERYLLLISTYPPGCLSMAVTLTDADVRDYSSSSSSSSLEATLQLPIHLACDKAAPLSIVKSLLDADSCSQETILKADKWGDLPIHIACSRASTALSASDQELYGHGFARPLPGDRDYLMSSNLLNSSNRNDAVETIRVLLEADKDKNTLFIKDVYKSLPLHTAARYNAPAEVISMLLEGRAKSGLYVQGFHGQFPLTVACRSGSPRPEVLRILIEHDDDASAGFTGSSSDHRQQQQQQQQPSTILHKDATGRLPIHVFMLRNTCEVCLRILLEGMLGRSRNQNDLPSRNSILRIGLDAWKRQWLIEMIPSMDGTSLYERDFTTRDKLEVICTEARAFYETCVGLELVVWKMSCLSGIREEKEEAKIGVTVSEGRENFKRNRRIVSGAEIIVPNVLSFLEDEPVERILEQFRAYGYLGQKN